MGPAVEKYGHDFKYDISMDPYEMDKMVKIVRDRIKEEGICVGFGHIGDENLHLLTSAH